MGVALGVTVGALELGGGVGVAVALSKMVGELDRTGLVIVGIKVGVGAFSEQAPNTRPSKKPSSAIDSTQPLRQRSVTGIDPILFFTNAGMNQFKDVFLALTPPPLT